MAVGPSEARSAEYRPPADAWAIPEVPLLSRTAHDRLAHRRTDEDWLDRAWIDPGTRVLVLSPAGTAAVSWSADGPDLVLRSPLDVTAEGIRILLGEHDGVAQFALLAREDVTDGGAPIDGVDVDWVSLRDIGAQLTDLDTGLLTTAVALGAWHARNTHCPLDGAQTDVTQAGWTRRCPVDGSQHFPRTDPAVIMLIHDGAGSCVLARGPQWPPGRMSVLAGFVEAGESAEAAVAREVGEEVGLTIADVTYVGSQPHPFPASLMLGYTARLAGDRELRIDGDEIVEAGWFTREEVRATGSWGDADDGSDAILRGLPPTMSIARQLINAWLLETD